MPAGREGVRGCYVVGATPTGHATVLQVVQMPGRQDRRACCSSLAKTSHCSTEAPPLTFLAPALAPAAAGMPQGVSGRFLHSRMHAVMGPSGCGKSSLCNLLAGKMPQKNLIQGDIRVYVTQPGDTKPLDLAPSSSFGLSVDMKSGSMKWQVRRE